MEKEAKNNGSVEESKIGKIKIKRKGRMEQLRKSGMVFCNFRKKKRKKQKMSKKN